MAKLPKTEEYSSITHIGESGGAYHPTKEQGSKSSGLNLRRMLALAVVAFVMLHELWSYFQMGKPGSAGGLFNSSDVQVRHVRAILDFKIPDALTPLPGYSESL